MKSPFIAYSLEFLRLLFFKSSSTTTSLIVAIAGGGLVQIGQAVPMVMGANIGTTVTNTLISMNTKRRIAFSAATIHPGINIFPFGDHIRGLAQGLSEFFITDFSVEFKSPIKSAVDTSFNRIHCWVYK